jgi:putative membrane protein (TIGR04086 family)
MKFIKKISKETSNAESSNVTRILRGSILSIVLTIAGLLIYSIILVNTEISENTINYVVIGIASISILIGSILSVSKIAKKGIFNGAIVGIYVIVIYLLSSTINSNFNINLSAIILMAASIIAGMIGGIIGVNMKR